jgi:hypothetical protein
MGTPVTGTPVGYLPSQSPYTSYSAQPPSYATLQQTQPAQASAAEKAMAGTCTLTPSPPPTQRLRTLFFTLPPPVAPLMCVSPSLAPPASPDTPLQPPLLLIHLSLFSPSNPREGLVGILSVNVLGKVLDKASEKTSRMLAHASAAGWTNTLTTVSGKADYGQSHHTSRVSPSA